MTTQQSNEVLVLRDKVALLKMALLTWDATFKKYQSWNANKVPLKNYRSQILADYEKLSSFTKELIS